MAIDRGPWTALVDDDGSNLVGSIWNKAAIKTVILDPVDAAFVTPIYGTFAIADGSGAALGITGNGGRSCKIGRLVTFWIHLVVPGNGSGNNVILTGLPFVCNATIPGGGVSTYGLAHIWHVASGTSNLYLYNPTTGVPRTNAELSGATLTVAGSYLTD